MKIICISPTGHETLICESVDLYHGLIIVKLLNGNFSTKNRKDEYKLVEMSQPINGVDI